MESASPSRVFLVGCPRSGTTALQALFTARVDVLTLPETHFFTSVVPRSWLRHLPLASRTSKDVLEGLGREFDVPVRAGYPALRSSQCQRFLSMMDELAVRGGFSTWLEKTPEHVLYLPLIESVAPAARFLHIVRDPLATAASLRDAAVRFPGSVWERHYPDGPSCLTRWMECAEATRAVVGRSGHLVVEYEWACADPVGLARRVGGFLGLELEVGSGSNVEAPSSAASIARSDEPWKRASLEGIRSASPSKFDSVFAEDQRAELAAMFAQSGLVGFWDGLRAAGAIGPEGERVDG